MLLRREASEAKPQREGLSKDVVAEMLCTARHVREDCSAASSGHTSIRAFGRWQQYRQDLHRGFLRSHRGKRSRVKRTVKRSGKATL